MTATVVQSKTGSSARRAPVFPSALLVDAAAGLFDRHQVAERPLGRVVDVDRGPSDQMARRLFPEAFTDRRTGEILGAGRRAAPGVGDQVDHELVEGPRSFFRVGPGMVSVRSLDPARRERYLERQAAAALARFRAGDFEDPTRGGACVTAWSSKSRNRMLETIGSLDTAPLLARGGRSVMLTLTYPGEWEEVASDSQLCRRQVDALRARWRRRFGVRLDGIWKREFQRRGAPHYHVWTVLPADVSVTDVRLWLGPAWASIVGHPDPEVRAQHGRVGCSVDASKGDRASDPRRLAVYFSKHGLFTAKEYQNHAPRQWVENGSVGRFWGVWGLRKALGGVEVSQDAALALTRTIRRHSRSNGYVAPVPAWKYRTVVDQETGEVRARWRRSTRRVRVYQMKGSAGFVLANDGPAFASQLARMLDARKPPDPGVRGPRGRLP